MLKSKKERSAAIQQSLMNGGSLYPLSFFDSRQYIQHNVLIPDGLGPILQFMDELPADQRNVRVCRAVEDGDISFVHNDYRLGDWGAMAGFEVHRWEGDRIVEHWDNLQSLPSHPNPSGRTMTDGATVVTDYEHTAVNKAVVERFTTDVLIARDLRRIGEFFHGDGLLQHNPDIGDGVAALVRSLGEARYRYDRLHRIIGEGNFVLAISEGRTTEGAETEAPTSFYDLYRLADGRIVEHWDVIERIAPRDQWRNNNGKF